MPDTKELVERVRETLLHSQRSAEFVDGSPEFFDPALAALSELEARLEAAERHLGDASDANCDLHEHLKAAERERDEFNDLWHTFARRTDEEMARVRELEEALRDLLNEGIDDIDPRLRYVMMQVGRQTLADARAALDAKLERE